MDARLWIHCVNLAACSQRFSLCWDEGFLSESSFEQCRLEASAWSVSLDKSSGSLLIVVGKFGIQILDGLPHQRVYVEGFGCWRSFGCWRVCLTDSLLIFGRSKFQASVDVLSCNLQPARDRGSVQRNLLLLKLVINWITVLLKL